MKNQGFTLIELIIAITIILVISTIAVPGVIEYQAFQNEEQFVNQVINRLRSYQNISLTKDKLTYFSLSSNSISFCEDSNCTSISSTNTYFAGNSDLNQSFRFNEFGDILKSQNKISSPVIIETPKFKITLSRFGGITKNAK